MPLKQEAGKPKKFGDMSVNQSHESESIQAVAEVDTQLERRLLWKLDLSLLPLFMLLLTLNYIDRACIGNAKVAGLEHDLGMEGFDFNIALTLFFVGYLIADIPSVLIQKRVGSGWISILVISFGAISFGTAFVHTFRQLVTTRILLGLAEGGLLSGLIYILSRYYRRKELVLRIGIFFGIAPGLAGAFGGLLASGLLTLDDFGPVHSWRKIFFVEGMITTGIGLLSYFVIPANPLETKLLTEPERALAIARLNADAVVKTNGWVEKTSFQLIKTSFSIWTWVCITGYAMIVVSFQGLAYFLPTVINGLGKYTIIEVQLRSVPPYAVAAIWSFGVSYWSFKYENRGIPVIISMVLQVTGYAIAIGTKNSHARYAACFMNLAGDTGSLSLFLTWVTDNSAPDTMRAVASALVTVFAAMASVVAMWTYLPSDAPDFHKGNSLNLALGMFVIVLTIIGLLYLHWENAKRELGERDGRIEGLDQSAQYQLGYRHPQFRYQM